MPDTALAEQPLAHPEPLLPDLDALMAGRIHEAVGPGRLAFALGLAGQLSGAVLWIADRARGDRLYPPGIAPYLDPARLHFVHPVGTLAVLQMTEEALRSGAAPLVVAELPEAPDLTASRRLQLAAGTGGGRGLCLIPEGRLCNNAAETRWMCLAMSGTPGAQQWEAIKNKRGRLVTWQARVAGGRFVAAERPH